MKKYGEGLGLEIVKGVNSGRLEEPITFEKVKAFCEENDLNPTENQMRVTLSNATENEHSPSYTKYFERTARGQYIVRNEYRADVGHYWLNVDPDAYEWSFILMEIGETQTYSSRNEAGGKRIKERSFKEIKIGDLVLVCELARTNALTSISKVVDKREENDVFYVKFAKQRHFNQHLSLEQIKKHKKLAESDVSRFRRGTLHAVPRQIFRTLARELEEINTTDSYYDKLQKEVEAARKDSAEERRSRLRNRKQAEPEQIERNHTIFKRNPDVIAEVLERAEGICENCGKPAPFNRSSDGTPYLEVHHHFRLSDGGEDTVENTMAVCPNCHRELHYG